jgi:hypothetical protein
MNNTHTIDDIRDLYPCYDPIEKLPSDWSGTIVDLLLEYNVPPQDRIWVVTQWISDKINRLLAVWCSRQASAVLDEPDPRLTAACDVAERYANGDATDEELSAALSSADAARNNAYAVRSAAVADIATYTSYDATSAYYNAARSASAACTSTVWVAATASVEFATAAAACTTAAADRRITYLLTLIESEN